MKRLVLLLAVMGTTLALAAGMALTQATTDTSHVTVSLDDKTIFNDCTVEEVLLTGELHIIFHQTEDPNGGLHVQSIFQVQGVSGTGLETGTQYKFVGANPEADFYFAPGERREVTTLVQASHIISKGSSDNLLTHCTIHLTLNANGEPTAELERLDTQCVG